jgi:hypothetical protein|tara:strand:+ start:12 stop:293 length:282 start_codon:yes stop_codon:yes gene_type:complete
MTDLSSKEGDKDAMAEMAGDLIQAKMDAARQPQNLTHLLKFGSFHMEIVPSKSIDVEKIFKDVIADLHDKFGNKILEIDIKGLSPQESGVMHQ